MKSDNILAAIDAEITRLQQARALLASTSVAKPSTRPTTTKPKRKMSAEARKRVAAAQKKQWAGLRKIKEI